MEVKMYAVPEVVAASLGLTRLRRKDAAGMWLLSSADLTGYGAQRAVSEGAEVLTLSEARKRFAE